MVIVRLTAASTAPARRVARVVGAVALAVLVLAVGDVGLSRGVAAVHDLGTRGSAGLRSSLTYDYDGAFNNASTQLSAAVPTRQPHLSDRARPLELVSALPSFVATVVGAEDGLTVAGERATVHGAERLTQAGFDEETIAATKSGLVTRQADGATVYVNEVAPGRYDFIVEGDSGVVTAHRGWSFKSVTRLANNYSWEGWPP